MLKEHLEFGASYLKHAIMSAFMFAFGVEIINGPPISLMFSIPYSEIFSGSLICIWASCYVIANFLHGFENEAMAPTVKGYVIGAIIFHIITFEVAFNLTSKIWN
jgi:hypothetical protein